MQYYLLCIHCILFSYFCFAKPVHSKFHKKTDPNIRAVLQLPLENRYSILIQYRKQASLVLRKLILSNKESVRVRWSALITLARVAHPHVSRPVILLSLRHPRWFLRNAGLLAMEILDPPTSLWWADRLLDDPSLLVRTASVDLIRRQKAKKYKWRLLEKLNESDSFYKNNSLWIRYHIVQTLADFAESGDEHFFITALQDTDKRLHSFALAALEKITGYQVAKPLEEDTSWTNEEWKEKWLTGWLQFQKKSVSL